MFEGPWLWVGFSFWYGCLVLWGWHLFLVIKTGDASSSGMELLRSTKPVHFWVRVGYEILIWFAMAAMPVGLVMTRR